MSDFNILALDGGGSRGIMEAVILQDLMNTVTMLRDHPEDLLDVIKNEKVSLFRKLETREAFAKLIDNVENPVHVTEAFDMISGTSTGALIGFSLVGGKEDPETGKRLPMTLLEIIDFYHELTPKIFQAFEGVSKYTNGLAKAVLGTQIDPFDNTSLLNFLEKYFGHSTLQDFDDKCIALATARRMEHNSEFLYDAMNSFDTKSHTSIKVTDVLMATTNVPIYFKTPWYIRGVPYVDGGLGANCSFSVAIPRMQELTDGQLQFGLSVGPSRTTQKVEPNGLKFWQTYFPRRSLDGYHPFIEAKAQHPPGSFMRLWPKSEHFKDFNTDDLRLTEMQEGVGQEKLQDPRYLQDIIVSALVIVTRLQNKDLKTLFDIAKVVMDFNIKSKNAEYAMCVAKAFAKLPTDDENEDLKNEALYYVALSYYGMNIFAQADEEFKKVRFSDDSDAKFWILKGKIDFQKGDFTDAEEALVQAKSIDESWEINLYLSKVLVATGKIDEALKLADNALLNEDQSVTCHKIQMMIDNGQIDEALEILGRCNIGEHFHSKADVASLEGQCFFLKGDVKESLQRHNSAIKYWNTVDERREDPEMIHALLKAGLAFMGASGARIAVEMLEKAHGIALKMYRGIDLSKHPWFANLTKAIQEARIAARSEPDVRINLNEPKPSSHPKGPGDVAAKAVNTSQTLVAEFGSKALDGASGLMRKGTNQIMKKGTILKGFLKK